MHVYELSLFVTPLCFFLPSSLPVRFSQSPSSFINLPFFFFLSSSLSSCSPSLPSPLFSFDLSIQSPSSSYLLLSSSFRLSLPFPTTNPYPYLLLLIPLFPLLPLFPLFLRLLIRVGSGMWSLTEFLTTVDFDSPSNSSLSSSTSSSSSSSSSSSVASHLHHLQQILLGLDPGFPEIQLRRYLSFHGILRVSAFTTTSSSSTIRPIKIDEPIENLLSAAYFDRLPPFAFFLQASRFLHQLTARSGGGGGVDYYLVDVVVQLFDLLVSPEALRDAIDANAESPTSVVVGVDAELRPLLERLRKTQSNIRDRINDLDGTRIKNHLAMIIQRWEAALKSGNDALKREDGVEGNMYDLFAV